MFTQKKILNIFSIACIILGLSSCIPLKSTIFEDTQCLPPCWRNIHPGESTSQEVLDTLKNSNDVDQNTIIDSSTLIDKSIYWKFTKKNGDRGGRIYFIDEKVAVIEINHKENSLAVLDAITILGQPKNVLALLSSKGHYWLTIYILYPEDGFALVSVIDPFQIENSAEVQPDLLVNGTYYFSPETFEEVFTNGPIAMLTPTILQTGIKPWNGFGEIEYIER